MQESTLKDRVLRLEESRFRTVGEINALRTMLLSAWMTLIRRSSSPPGEAIAQLKDAWLSQPSEPLRAFPGIDSSELGAIAQEYEKSIARLLADLEGAVLDPSK